MSGRCCVFDRATEFRKVFGEDAMPAPKSPVWKARKQNDAGGRIQSLLGSRPLPVDAPLLIHLSLVIVLMLIFPFSKLLHAPGVFFSPTRNMRDTPREHRHVTPWAQNSPATDSDQS